MATSAYTTTVEFGVKITWPNGHSEVHGEGSRRLAEGSVRMHDNRMPEPNTTAEVVARQVTVTNWAPMPVETEANQTA